MKAATLAAIAALATAGGCASWCAATSSSLTGASPMVEEHTHATTETEQSCLEQCYPGICLSSYGLSEQDRILCNATPAAKAVCICQGPVD